MMQSQSARVITALAFSCVALVVGFYFVASLEQIAANVFIPLLITGRWVDFVFACVIMALLAKIARLLAVIAGSQGSSLYKPEIALHNPVQVQVQNCAHFEHRNKPSKQLLKAVAWIEANDTGLTVREIAKEAGVSVGTAHNAREFIKSQRGI